MSVKNKKRILLGITGGIAAYKSLSLIRLFIQQGCEVRVVATTHALQFVTPLSIETLSQNKLYHDLFSPLEKPDVEHVAWADWADAFVVAPCSANIIGKLSHGIADDALSTLLLAYDNPLFLAPSMNNKMYAHPAVQENLRTLAARGIHLIEPSTGFLACGTEGKGRMEEPEIIAETVLRQLDSQQLLKGKKVLVTAGPTYEPIDPVRFMGNHSSGLMGFALAEQFAWEGAEVLLITGPTHLTLKNPAIQRVNITTAQEMERAVLEAFPSSDITVMAAAVADYTPVEVASTKIKKKDPRFSLELRKTTDILWELGQRKSGKQYLAGFALETDREKENAWEKLQNKNLDLIVLNSMKIPGTCFKTTDNQVIMITKDRRENMGLLKGKEEVARDIVQFIIQELPRD